MSIKSTHHLLLLLLALRAGVVNGRLVGSHQMNISVPPNMGPNQRPKTNKDSTHISDFTDPDTGLNPFLDLQEGRTGAFGRRFKDQDRPLPRPYQPPVTHNTDIIEGESSDGMRARVGGDGRLPDGRTRITANPRWRSWSSHPSGRGDYSRQPPQTSIDDFPSNSQRTRNGHAEYPIEMFDFDRFAEPTSSAEEHSTSTTPPPSTAEQTTSSTSSSSSSAALRTSTTLDINTGTSEFYDVAAVTSTPENPFSSSVTMSALVIGSVVFVLALIVPFAWICLRRKRRLLRTVSQQHAAYVEAQAESENCENNDRSENGRDFKVRT